MRAEVPSDTISAQICPWPTHRGNLPLGYLQGGCMRAQCSLHPMNPTPELPSDEFSAQEPTTLEATQGRIDGFLSQLPCKCHPNRVVSVGD